jgi:hypothetical protein
MSCAHFYADVVGQCVFSAEHSLAHPICQVSSTRFEARDTESKIGK